MVWTIDRYLENNMISYISNGTFAILTKVEYLYVYNMISACVYTQTLYEFIQRLTTVGIKSPLPVEEPYLNLLEFSFDE